MKVVSLFDGISCGYEALKRCGLKIDKYYAFEIDKHAIKVAKKNHSNIIHCGSVIDYDFSQFKDIDLLIGGSPCQGFSMAGKRLAFNDERSKLFFEFVRALKEIDPKYFLLENVVMLKEHQAVINKELGVFPIKINSSLLSAQNRERLYWCNWQVRQPKDKKIYLKDIVEYGVVDRNKSYCIDANYHKGGSVKNYKDKKRRQIVYSAAQRGRNIVDGKRKDIKGEKTKQRIETNYNQKSNALTSVQKDSLILVDCINGKNTQSNRIYDINGKASSLISSGNKSNYLDDFEVRKLTPIECERLQTLPDDYTGGISNTQRYKALGNGWTVDVICHILNELYFTKENDINCQTHQQLLF